jgi:hypothetical protein
MKYAVRYRWTDGAWVPWRRFAAACEKEFAEGEDRWLEAIEDRSAQSHRHYFACIAEAWANLPEDLALRFPTPQTLRKWALIEAGWFVAMEPFTLTTPSGALRLAACLTKEYPDDRITIDPSDPRTVSWKTAKSQSMRSMGKRDFQRSKDDVLDKISELVGVSAEELARNAGKAA